MKAGFLWSKISLSRNEIKRTERSLCKDSVRPPQRTQFYSIRKKNSGILGTEIPVLCRGYRTVHIYVLCGQKANILALTWRYIHKPLGANCLSQKPEGSRKIQRNKRIGKDIIKIDIKQRIKKCLLSRSSGQDLERAILKAAMRKGFHTSQEISLQSKRLSVSQAGNCSMELVTCVYLHETYGLRSWRLVSVAHCGESLSSSLNPVL